MTEDHGPIESDVEYVVGNATFSSGGEPPKVDPKKLDFSEFHPLMHRLGSRECRSYYGGPKRHVQIWWWYKFEYKPKNVWHRWVLCRLGRHVPMTGWSRADVESEWVSRVNCRYCICKLPGGGEVSPPSQYPPRRSRPDR
jgi:hypothetical protein